MAETEGEEVEEQTPHHSECFCVKKKSKGCLTVHKVYKIKS